MTNNFAKVDVAADFPAMCFCNSQKGPLVDTSFVKNAYGHVYLCRLCVTRAARELGLIKGPEYERLMFAADELAQAEREIAQRQEWIDELTRTNGAREEKIAAMQAHEERQQAEISHLRTTLNSVIAMAKDAVMT